jgi:hypothetical protein
MSASKAVHRNGMLPATAVPYPPQITFDQREKSMNRKILIALALSAVSAAPAAAQLGSPAGATAPAHEHGSPAVSAGPYAPFDWLIGDWYGEAGPGMLRELITYGPGKSYIRFSAFTFGKGEPQHLHFEGIAVWNAKTKMLDYLFAVEPGSGVQENGTYRVEADGSIIREVELIDAKGNSGTFRQTFRRTGRDSSITTVMRKTATGWEPTFAGGDKIELKRQPG